MKQEDEIFKKLKNGDSAAVDELIKLYYGDIFRYCCFRLRDRTMAEDAVQETFLKVIRFLKNYRHQGKFRAFLYQVASNTCVDICRKKQWEMLPSEVPADDLEIQKVEEREDFLRLIQSLPQELGELVILRFSQELRLREIAQITGLPLRTVQSRLRRALKMLEKEMKTRGIKKGELL